MAHFDGRGFRTHYVEEGTGPAVVFLHELGTDHTLFAAQFEDLPERYRCLAPDLRGHGRSAAPRGPWTMQDIVVDVIRFIEHTNAAPAHLVGASVGGMAALRVALQREDLVRSLVLIGTNADSEDPQWAEFYRAFQKQIDDAGEVTEQIARETLPVFYGPSYIESFPEAVDVHVERLSSMRAEDVVEGLRAVLESDSVIDRLGELRVATLVIHGELDSAVSMSRSEAMASAIAGAEMLRVPGVGHLLPVEAPDVVNDALAGFLSRVKR